MLRLILLCLLVYPGVPRLCFNIPCNINFLSQFHVADKNKYHSVLVNFFSFQYCETLLFVDCEGDPVQELSAIEVRASDFAIIDVFHAHADVSSVAVDAWSRKNVHGLSLDFLNQHAFPSQHELCAAFHVWYSKKQTAVNFANNPVKETKFLNIKLTDVQLPIWVERINCPAHRIALAFKRHETPVGNSVCYNHIHNCYSPSACNEEVDARMLAKREWGHHCSLYDAFEAYLHFSHDI